jgi:hypothetical protein
MPTNEAPNDWWQDNGPWMRWVQLAWACLADPVTTRELPAVPLLVRDPLAKSLAADDPLDSEAWFAPLHHLTTTALG